MADGVEASCVKAFQSLQITGDEGEGLAGAVKDPRKIARRYQLELCRKALQENIIVYLGTGCGKTHIAVLLIYEFGHLIRKPQKNVCIFLAPTVALVQQQARVIEESIDFKVGIFCGNSHLKSHRDWAKEIEKYEVLVMTPQILLQTLSHRFIKMELIALMVFDECHHAQLESSHPYAEIMRVFYKPDVIYLPRVFGMTASPKIGKGASISGLETLLHAKVYTVEDVKELDKYVTSPKIKVYDYGSDCTSFHINCLSKLEQIKQQCTSMLYKRTDNASVLRSSKKALTRLHRNLTFCLESLGLLGAFKASHILLKGDQFERTEVIEDEFNDRSISDEYLVEAASFFASECSGGSVDNLSVPGAVDDQRFSEFCAEDSMELLFSQKLIRLVRILANFRAQQDMKCIVFVNRIVIARSLSKILQNLKNLSSWKSDFLVGIHSGLKSMSRKSMNAILKKFRSGELNLLVATKVGEEGLDIQTCCLVVRFDLPETVSSFIQSRGRARMPQSEYAFLVNRGSQREINLIEAFVQAEEEMKKEVVVRPPGQKLVDSEAKTYRDDLTLATISSGSSISLLYRYCSKLPHDEYFNPKPDFFYFDNNDGTSCHIMLPSNAPVHQIVGTPQPSKKSAKKNACLKACEQLHKLGALTSYLLPDESDDSRKKEDLMLESSDSECLEDDESRGALYEMLTPAALKEPWAKTGNGVHLNSYFIKFTPIPDDRLYKKFGLFLKALLPKEAERMKVDLHLARGRDVLAELVPAGLVKFSIDEISQAEAFQEMFLKAILDRMEFVPEYVPLKSEICESGISNFYLLLPVILDEYRSTVAVDWKTVGRCLSSPIFKMPADILDNENYPRINYLQLKNGPTSINDVKNSLIYVPIKKKFFFVSTILPDKNAYSQHSESMSHRDYLYETFGMELEFPEQPLLQAKQLFCMRNLLHDRKNRTLETHELEECFFELPPELCELKIIGFSKDIGSSISLLPSIMHRLENLLVAIELKNRLAASFPEGAKVTALRVLEALTTERCNERLSLERLEVLGDAFLKYAVARHLFLRHDAFDEGQLTRKRSDIVNNSSLFKLGTMQNIQGYIRDQAFDPCQYFVLGRPCPVICDKETEPAIHYDHGSDAVNHVNLGVVRCTKSHHWLHKKTVSDVIEALLGAFIVDSGFKAAAAYLQWIGIEVNFEAWQVNEVCTVSSRFMPLMRIIDVAALEKSLGYKFAHRGLLLEAFLHPSYNKLGGGCYQRLEFLGDAALDYLITSYLYSVYPRLKPGQLTDLRSMSVNNNSFAKVAISRSFHQFIICDSSGLHEAINKYADFIQQPAANKDLPKGLKCPKALGDLVESSFAAILVDTGFDLNILWKIMVSTLDPTTSFSSLELNPIRELQELRQLHKWDLQFSAYKKNGVFIVEAKLIGNDMSSSACASNANKAAAKRMASEQLCEKLKDKGYKVKSKSLELEEILNSSYKLEAKLIGNDETPISIRTQVATGSYDSNMQTPFVDGSNLRANCTNKTLTDMSSMKTSRLQTGNVTESDLIRGVSLRGTARSYLYDFCAATDWEPPLFECCKEEGPSHLKSFTFRVVLTITEGDCVTLECHGAPRQKKKDAAENAAEGAIWYLKQMGYLPSTK